MNGNLLSNHQYPFFSYFIKLARMSKKIMNKLFIVEEFGLFLSLHEVNL